MTGFWTKQIIFLTLFYISTLCAEGKTWNGKHATGDQNYLQLINDIFNIEINTDIIFKEYSRISSQNLTHLTLYPILNGYPIYGHSLRLHSKKLNNLTSASITAMNEILMPVNDSPIISQTEAIQSVFKSLKYPTQLQVKAVDLVYFDYQSPMILAYRITTASPDYSGATIVDSQTGEIIRTFSHIYSEDVIGQGTNLLGQWVDSIHVFRGTDIPPLPGPHATPILYCEEYCWDYGACDNENYSDCVPSYSQGNCPEHYLEDCNGECFHEWYMQFPGIGNGFCNDPMIEFDLDQFYLGEYNTVDVSTPELGSIYTISSFGGFYVDLGYINSSSPTFESLVNSNSHRAGVSSQEYHRNTLDYFWNFHQYAGMDGNGMRTAAVVNYGAGGPISPTNAFYNAGLNFLSYGIAGGSYRPFCAAQDIVTHEFVHSFTAHTSGLVYENQPGALNESLSDIFGYLVEAHYQDGGDWLQGEDIHLSGAGSRSFSNPPQYGQPDHIDHNYFVPYADNPDMYLNDFGGVHTNSGIPNKVFYLMVQGDEHYGIQVASFEEDIVQSRHIASNIWYAWNAFYLDIFDDFSISRDKMLLACNDLYPGNFDYYQTVSNAWASVGIGDPIVAGDLNDDFTVNIQDVIIMVNFILGNTEYTNEQLLTADLNQDNLFTVVDILLIINIIIYS